jgi:hypothetical protein
MNQQRFRHIIVAASSAIVLGLPVLGMISPARADSNYIVNHESNRRFTDPYYNQRHYVYRSHDDDWVGHRDNGNGWVDHRGRVRVSNGCDSVRLAPGGFTCVDHDNSFNINIDRHNYDPRIRFPFPF